MSLPETRRSRSETLRNNPVSSVKDVRIQFGFLVTKVINQLEKNDITLDNVASELDINLDSPKYLDDYGLRLTDIDELFDFLRSKGYMPFYSLAMLEKVVDSFAKECQQALNDYKDGCLKPFLFKCLPQVEEECFEHKKVAGQVNLVITIDREWDTTTMLDVLELTKNVAAIINIPHEHLVIDTVRPGSVIVESRIPHRVYSLTCSQKRELEELAVKKLVCDGHEVVWLGLGLGIVDCICSKLLKGLVDCSKLLKEGMKLCVNKGSIDLHDQNIMDKITKLVEAITPAVGSFEKFILILNGDTIPSDTSSTILVEMWYQNDGLKSKEEDERRQRSSAENGRRRSHPNTSIGWRPVPLSAKRKRDRRTHIHTYHMKRNCKMKPTEQFPDADSLIGKGRYFMMFRQKSGYVLPR